MSDPQAQLFELPSIERGGGAFSLTQNKNIALPHEQTAELLKAPNTGVGKAVSLVGGTAEIQGFSYRDGRITWTIAALDVELEL